MAYLDKIQIKGISYDIQDSNLKNAVWSALDGIAEYNLFETAGCIKGYYINAQGVETAGAGFAHTGIISVTPNQAYHFTGAAIDRGSGWTMRFHAYKDGVWGRQLAEVSVPGTGGTIDKEIPIGADENGVIISYIAAAIENPVFVGPAGETAIDKVARSIGEAVKQIANLPLYFPQNNTDKYYLNDSGTPISEANSAYTELIPVTAGKTYVFSADRTAGASEVLRVHGYLRGVWQQQITTIGVYSTAGVTREEITIPSGIDSVRISLYHLHTRLSNVSFTANIDGGLVTAIDRVARAEADSNSEIIASVTETDGGVATAIDRTAREGMLTALKREAIALGLNTVPDNVGMLNAIKRARQMTDIRWTPCATLYRASMITPDEYGRKPSKWFFDRFMEGKEYKGLPYSSTRWIGNDYSLDAFVTAAARNDSIMITGSSKDNDVKGGHDISTYYGTVCTTLVSYALDIPIITSQNYAADTPPSGFQIIQKIQNNGEWTDLDGLRLCDVLAVESHVALITDIRRDANGHVTDIEVSESTKYGNLQWHHQGGQHGGVCRRKWWTLESFRKWFRIFDIRRFQDFSGIGYTRNAYVPMAGEGEEREAADLSCVPEFGNRHRAILGDGETVEYKLLTGDTAFSNLGGGNPQSPFTKVGIKKDGADFETKTITDNTVTITLGSEGVYTAQMQTEDPYNEGATVGGIGTPCEWAVLRHGKQAAAKSDEKYRVTVRRMSGIARPTYAIFNGSSKLYAKIPWESVKLSEQSATAYDYTFDIVPPVDNVTSIRVHFDTDKFGGYYENDITSFITITEQPIDYTGSIGDTAVFTVAASGMASYQWMWRNQGASKWNTTTATGNKTEQISVDITAARLNYEYCCLLINADGSIVYTDAVKIIEA